MKQETFSDIPKQPKKKLPKRVKHIISVKTDTESYFQQVTNTIFFMTLYGQHWLTQYEMWNSKNYFRQTNI